MIEYLEHIDRAVFLFLNGLNHPILDKIMWFVSGKMEWIPLYLLLAYLIIKNYGKQSIFVLLGAGALIAASDQSSVHLFKEFFERYRPCHNLEIQDLIHQVNNKCGGQFGFVSSHAANSFGIALYLGLFLRVHYKWALPSLLFWAAVVSYSRIYLGVHYPSDVIVGAILGCTLAFLFHRLLVQILKKKKT